jgi:hypothetical protein
MDGSTVKHSIYEQVTWQTFSTGLFGEAYTPFSSVGLLNHNVIIVSAGERGLIAIPNDSLSATRDLKATELTGVKRLQIGRTVHQISTVKDKSFAFVVASSEQGNSVLAQVKWSSDRNELELVNSHSTSGTYTRLFVEE